MFVKNYFFQNEACKSTKTMKIEKIHEEKKPFQCLTCEALFFKGY